MTVFISCDSEDWLGASFGLSWAHTCSSFRLGSRASAHVVFLPGFLYGVAGAGPCIKRAEVEASGPLVAQALEFTWFQCGHILLARASHMASPDSRECRNILCLWMGEMAKSHCREAHIKDLWPLSNSMGRVLLLPCRPRLLLI